MIHATDWFFPTKKKGWLVDLDQSLNDAKSIKTNRSWSASKKWTASSSAFAFNLASTFLYKKLIHTHTHTTHTL